MQVNILHHHNFYKFHNICFIFVPESVHFYKAGYSDGFSHLFSLSIQFGSVQSLNLVWLFATPWTAACQASLSITNSRCLYSCPLSLWCHPTTSSSVVPFSSCLQSFPASGFFLYKYYYNKHVNVSIFGCISDEFLY